MPRLWSETIESHRTEVREAIVDSTAALASSRGPFNVTMSEIAETVGISRATLYKYFPSVEDILDAWHEGHIEEHLAQLNAEAIGDQLPVDRLTTVLTAYAQALRHRGTHDAGGHSVELTSFLHRPDGVARDAAERVRSLVQDVLTEAATSGKIRSDVPPAELAQYCLHALDAAPHLHSDSAVDRLIGLVLSSLDT